MRTEKHRKRPVMLHISVTREIADELKKLAKQQGRTVTELAREAFSRIIMDYNVEERVKEILKRYGTDRGK